MKIQRLHAVNFRNLPELNLEIGQDLVVLVGPNAAGKTNFLEAVFYASTLQAFPPRKSWELIRFGEDFFRLTVEVDETKLEYYYGRKDEKKYIRSQSIDGVKKKSGEIVGKLPVVSFSPQDLNLLILSPNLRRDYLDEVLLQTEPDFENLMTEYGKVLTQRNELLSRINAGEAKVEELDFWDAQLADCGFKVISLRKNLVDSLNDGLPELYQKITGSELDFCLIYVTASAVDGEATRESLMELIQRKRRQDIATEQTNVGPHRDDWRVEDSGKREITRILSRGEQRSVIIALKLQELNILEKALGKPPVILMDELLAELDETRQKYILEGLPENSQKFLTTTELKSLPDKILEDALVIELGEEKS